MYGDYCVCTSGRRLRDLSGGGDKDDVSTEKEK